MPRNVRNFWIDADIDGRAARLSGGPQARDGGFDMTIYQREDGSVSEGVSVRGRCISGGLIVLTVDTRIVVPGGHRHEEVFRLTTHRDESRRDVYILNAEVTGEGDVFAQAGLR